LGGAEVLGSGEKAVESALEGCEKFGGGFEVVKVDERGLMEVYS
jgi:hypothetical protein